MNDGAAAVFVLDLHQAVRGFAHRTGHTSPSVLWFQIGPNRVLVEGPFTNRPLDDLRGRTGEVAGHLRSLVAPQGPTVLDRPVVRRSCDGVVRLVIVGPRFPRIEFDGRPKLA